MEKTIMTINVGPKLKISDGLDQYKVVLLEKTLVMHALMQLFHSQLIETA